MSAAALSEARDRSCCVAPIEDVVRLARSYPVFPCRRHPEWITAGGRKRLLKPKSPLTLHGFQDATQDPDQIRAWWRRWPDALVGVPTGARTGLLVVDFDSHKADEAAREWINEHTDWLLQTRSHKTLNGGRHYLYGLPPGALYGSGVNLTLGGGTRVGIDLRCEGGYIIWWPLHGGVSTGEIAALPPGLVDERRIEKRELPPLPAQSPAAWARDRQRLADALAWLDPSSYETWSRAGMALHLHSGGSDDGFMLWHAWSAGEITGEVPASYSGIEDCRYHWASYRQDKPRDKMVTVASLFQQAKGNGWAPPSARQELPPMPDAPADDPGFSADDDRGAKAAGDGAAAGQGPPRELLPLEWADDLEDDPTYEPMLVDGLLERQGKSMVFGASGSGKSTLVIDWCCGIAAGRLVGGRHTSRGLVAYVGAEAVEGARRRVRAYRKHHQIARGALPLAIYKQPLSFEPAMVRALVLTMKAAAAARGMPVVLVVVDTLAANEPGKEDAEHFGRVTAALDIFARELECQALVVHHAGKVLEAGARGHTSLYAGMDTVVEVSSEGPGRSVAKVAKQRDGATGEAFAFGLVPVGVGFRKTHNPAVRATVTACVVEYHGAVEVRPKAPREGHQTRAMDALRLASSEQGQRRWTLKEASEVIHAHHRRVVGERETLHRNTPRKTLEALARAGHVLIEGGFVTLEDG